MKYLNHLFALSAGLFMSLNLSAQGTVLVKRDPVINEMVQQISADSIEAHIRKLVSFGTRHTLSSQTDPNRGIGAAGRWIHSKFEEWGKESGGRLESKLDYFTLKADGRRVLEDKQVFNVVATLKGTDPNDDRVLIVSGHMDSRAADVNDPNVDAPGANDDGSGTAAVMEMVRVMSKKSFPHTIIFMTVTGEEQGLYGARYMAEKAKAENWNLVAMLNNDMIGNSFSSGTNLNDNMRVRIFSEGVPAYETEQMEALRKQLSLENDGIARQLARYSKEVGERYVDQLEVKLIYRNDRFLRGGDHTPFIQNGFAAIRFCEMNENYKYQHQNISLRLGEQYGDLPEYVDFEYIRKITGMNVAVLANLAKAPAAPKRAGINIRLENGTTLSWEEPDGPKPKGYYVLMRETDQSMWQRKFYVEGNQVTLPYSKDNYFFAVQAVSADGHESLPVVPLPTR
jgi:Zn-dependent M28 family amino/carboxypeptidase